MATENPGYTLRELMVAAAAREIRDGEVIFVGMRLPLLAFFLAMGTRAGRAVGIYELGIVRDSAALDPVLTMGDLPNLYRAQWLADTGDVMGILQQGLVDASFIGGAQIDRFGNLNTSYTKGPRGDITRLPGSGGACDLATLGKRHIIIMAHEKHRFVPAVDYITSPGYGTGGDWRTRNGLAGGGPSAVITTLGIMNFHEVDREMVLTSLHPGVTVDQVRENTGWPLRAAENINVTEPPGEKELEIIRRLDPKGFWSGA